MLAALEEMQRRRKNPSGDAFIFPSPYYPDRPYQHNAIGDFIRRRLNWEAEITAHGFRNTLTDWAEWDGKHEPLLLERQFDHLPQGQVQQAYSSVTRKQSDDPTLERRRLMMEAWGAYCDRPEPYSDVKVINFKLANN